MADTRFALCPSGTGPNSIRLWEAIEFGCIPVILSDDLRLPGDMRLWRAASVIVDEREEAIADLPRALESLENDRDLIATKLRALKEIQARYGRDSFVTDIRLFCDAIAQGAEIRRNGQRQSTHRIYLSTGRLDDRALLGWVCFLNAVFETLDLRAVLFLDAKKLPAWVARLPWDGRVEVRAAGAAFPLLHDWRGEDLAVVGDSATLSRPLLSRFRSLWIKTRHAPGRVNTSLFDEVALFRGAGSGAYARYERIARDFGCGAPLGSLEEWRPMCTLVTSMFRGDEYLAGFLENSEALEDYERIEHLIARPNSPGREHSRLVDFVQHNPGAVYIWLKHDPGLYEVWNTLCRLGTSPCLSNFNIDDRRAPAHVRTLVAALHERSDVDVASAALRVSQTKNQPWPGDADAPLWYAGPGIERYAADRLLTVREGQVVSHNMPHCMPVWRRLLHVSNGFFDEARFGPSADWEFWLRTGKDDAGFHLHGEPLGLYLKTQDSYWRRSEGASAHDQRIIDTYSDAAGNYRVRRDDWPFALRVADMMDARQNGQVARYLWSLLELKGAAEGRFAQLPALRQLVCAALEDDFGIVDPGATDRVTCTQAIQGVPQRLAPLAWMLVDALHAVSSDRISRGSRALHSIRQFFDELALGGPSCEVDLVKAFLERIEGDEEGEAHFLRKAHARDSERFWNSLQAVYRFTVPLEKVCALIGTLPAFYRFEDLAAGETLYFLPDYTHGNPYQRLLYRGLEERGVSVRGIGSLEDLEKDGSIPKPGDVLHVHWINYLYKGVDDKDYPRVIDEFLNAVREMKERGVRVFWTVHNRYSHDLQDIGVEKSFRQRLSSIADRVLVHHPCLLRHLAEWLPDNATVNFVEHGNYIGEYENAMSREEARAALGLAPHDVVISVIGQVRPYKDLHRYLSAIRKAMARQSRLKLVVAGRISCEKTATELKKMPQDQVVVEDRFIKESEFQRFLNAASFVFLSYKNILTSGSLFQALSFNVPTIAPALGSIPAYLVNGWNGFVYADPTTFERSLEEVIDSISVATDVLQGNAIAAAMSAKWPDGR